MTARIIIIAVCFAAAVLLWLAAWLASRPDPGSRAARRPAWPASSRIAPRSGPPWPGTEPPADDAAAERASMARLRGDVIPPRGAGHLGHAGRDRFWVPGTDECGNSVDVTEVQPGGVITMGFTRIGDGGWHPDQLPADPGPPDTLDAMVGALITPGVWQPARPILPACTVPLCGGHGHTTSQHGDRIRQAARYQAPARTVEPVPATAPQPALLPGWVAELLGAETTEGAMVHICAAAGLAA